MDIGAALQDARQKRGLSLESVSAKTKISLDLLRAIEINAFERLPAGVFARGFLRAYAREVGVDADRVVSQYQANLSGKGDPTGPVGETPTVPAQAGPHHEGSPVADAWSLAFRPWPIAAVLVAAVAFYLFGRPAGRQPAVQTATGAVEASAPQAQPVPSPVATTGRPFQINVEATRDCWVSATADGQRVIYRTLRHGERHTMSVQDVLNLRVGDAGALTFSIDGIPGRPVGGPGQPVTVLITRENFRDFLVKNER